MTLQIDADDLEHLGYASAFDGLPRSEIYNGYEICRGISNHKRRAAREDALRLFECGYPNRGVARILGISKTTVKLYRKKFTLRGMAFRCLCGQASTHQGWCRWRFERSEARQEFMRRWHSRKGGE